MEKPSFFKVLIGDFKDKLQLPPEFVKNFNGLLPRECLIRSRIGTWNVEITGANGTLYFNVGWKEFVEDHSLELGDFLTFEYDGDTEFLVKVFGKTACEKDFPMDGRKENRTCQGESDEVLKNLERNGVEGAKSNLNNISLVKEKVFGKTACENDFSMDGRKENKTCLGEDDEVLKNLERNGVEGAKSNVNNISQVKEKVFGKTACEHGFAMDGRKKNRTRLGKNDEVPRNGVERAKSNLNNISQVKKEPGDDFWIESLKASPVSKKRQRENTVLPSSSSYKQNEVGNASRVEGFVPSSFNIDNQKKAVGDHRNTSAYKSENLSIQLTMKPSYVGFNDSKAYMPLPTWFARTHLSRKHEVIVLLVSYGNLSKRWTVKYSWRTSHLHSGWLKFVRDNCLKVNDICVFEAVKEELNTLKVAILGHKEDADGNTG